MTPAELYQRTLGIPIDWQGAEILCGCPGGRRLALEIRVPTGERIVSLPTLKIAFRVETPLAQPADQPAPLQVVTCHACGAGAVVTIGAQGVGVLPIGPGTTGVS